jgi:tetratricopeptide (TPR) repeat protein
MAKSALIEELEKQFNENPRRVFARLANEYRKTGDLELAIDICRTHIPQQPSYISGYIVLGQALFETQQLDDAKSTFETALGLDPENLIALRQLGDIARVLGDADTARAWYQRLLEVDPQNEEAAAQLQALPAPTPPSTPREAPSSELDEFGWREINPASAAVAEEPAAEPSAEPAAALPEVESLTDWMTPTSPATPAAQSDAVAEHEPVDLETTLEIPVVAPPDETPPAVPASTELPMLDEAPVAAAAPAAPPALDLDDDLVADAVGAVPDEREPAVTAEEPVEASFVTETMAELYERQGFRPEALRIYRQLAEQRPDDGELRRKIAELEGSGAGEESERVTIRQFFTRIARLSAPGLAADVADAAPDEGPAGEPDARDADVTPVEGMDAVAESPLPAWMTPASADAEPAPAAAPDEPELPSAATVDTPTPVAAQEAIVEVATLFPEASVAPADDDAARALSSAFTDAGASQSDTVPGEPARPAPDELSLDDVFRELSGGKRDSRPNGAVSFDEFFSNAGEGGGPAGTENGAQPGEPKSGDLESFHAWLEGLKK